MLRLLPLAVLATSLTLPAQDQELTHDDGEMAGKQSSAGTGHVISFDAPKGRRWLRAVRVYGARYGGGYDPRQTPFVVAACDDSMRELTRTEASYSLFAAGRFAWVDVPLDPPIEVEGRFRVVVAFDPARTRGVYVGWSTTDEPHSAFGLPGQTPRPFEGEWMIRAVLTKRRPRGAAQPRPASSSGKRTRVYAEDLDFLLKTVRRQYPALKKKGIDWTAVSRRARPAFRAANDDGEHLANVYRLIAELRDTHSSVRSTKAEVHDPSFDGLFGAGSWIASDRGRLLLRDQLGGAGPDGEPLARGAELIEIDGRPARLVHAEVCARLRTWHGWSSDHFLDARISTQFFPFGTRERLPVSFLTPGGKVVRVELERFGPGGAGLSRQAVTMPAGTAAAGLAVSTKLDGDLGYVRILGKMDDATREQFFAAFDELRGVRGMVLDCRGMGGGGDTPAWTMAGRFFTERTSNGTAPALEPTGSWQFSGPVVMLQDEREVSSAETFTWAMTETGRVVSVGRPTGGATIIPRIFELPSGLAEFRIGVHDRKTPIRGVQPEGIGTPPDVFVPYEPFLLELHDDPIRAVGVAVLEALIAGIARDEVVATWGGILGADPDRLRGAGGKALAALPAWLRDETVGRMIDHELLLATHEANPMPDFAGARERLRRLADVARRLGQTDAAKRAAATPAGWDAEIAAQTAWQELVAREVPIPPAALRRFQKAHGKTRYGEAMR